MGDEVLASPELQHEIEQWYYREARMLDDRRYQKWLGLCAPEIRYIVPGRSNPLVDNARRGHEDMISIEHELEGHESDGLPIRNETLPYLMLRVERSFKANAWAENPPARTRRIVGNVEITGIQGDEISVVSAFHLHWTRPGSPSFLYAGQRRDLLQRAEGGAKGDLRIRRREVVLDMADIELPTLGLFL
ncbi:MAG: aromatic-ring-hydroxylating dioxygenase subunit beta [Deltaproteobacteria bacterium]|jgi:3-phenylpropionate/cinnamic acid dioxygenase small subunit|nr:aromatic-ring-hydroxylating dioxygenase subunit beta [Deltaproteobacteria bacterium]